MFCSNAQCRFRYMKYLYPYECEKEKLSSPEELQSAIDGNRREGRRSSYGHYSEMVGATPPPSGANRNHSSHHTSPLSLVSRQLNGHNSQGLSSGKPLHNISIRSPSASPPSLHLAPLFMDAVQTLILASYPMIKTLYYCVLLIYSAISTNFATGVVQGFNCELVLFNSKLFITLQSAKCERRLTILILKFIADEVREVKEVEIKSRKLHNSSLLLQ